MSIQLSLHARSEPAADWHAQLTAMHELRQREAAQAAALQRAGALHAGAGAAASPGRTATRELVPARRLQRA